MPKKTKPATAQQLRGKVLAFNISPKGEIEGALLETNDGLSQVNFPRHNARLLAQSMRVGGRVEMKVELENNDGAHPVYLTDAEDTDAEGVIVGLNHALHGEVNGYHLEDGTFLHVKPDRAKKYKLRIGDKVKAAGSRRTGADAVVLEVNELQKLRNPLVNAAEA
jgi:hypothetical protein